MQAKIGLKDVRIHAPHGFFEEEQHMGNEFSIDVEVDAQIGGAARQDDLGQTVNYATIYYLLKAEMKHPTQLLEALAYRMATRIADQFDNVSRVKLRIHKLNPPLGGKVGSSWVEVDVAASQGSREGFGSDFSRARTFEDYNPHFDVDGPFAGPGGGGGMTGAPTRPASSPPPPLITVPTLDEFDLLDTEEQLADLTEEDSKSHAVTDEDVDLDDFELPDDFDPRSIPGLENFNFDDLD